MEYIKSGIENSENYSKSIGRGHATTTFDNPVLLKENQHNVVNSQIIESSNIAQPKIIPTYLGKEIYHLIVV